MSMTDAVVRALAAIQRSEAEIHAWAHLAADEALAAAAALDATCPDERRPLHGVVVGVKDIIDVAGQPTVAGFAPFAARPPAARDAVVVERLRQAGAVILGKTVTTQFAVSDPPVTRNPWDLARTPGGSSSGSAAAVAAGHVDLALGSQTTGSTLRPAAYCGVYGLKPSFGWVPRDGMFPLAHSLDHVGLLARSLRHVEAAFAAIVAGFPGPERLDEQPAGVPRIGVWREPLAYVAPEIAHLFTTVIDTVADAGAAILDAPEVEPYERIFAIQQVIFAAEAAATHRDVFARYAEDYAPKVRAFVESGSQVPAHAYIRARELQADLRERVAAAWAGLDAIVLPTASTTAPGPETTGDTTLQAAATLLGFPAISVPAGLASDGLPWGIQLIATAHGTTRRLLATAGWIDHYLPKLPIPSAITRDLSGA